MATRYYRHDDFLLHPTPEGHPERPDRLRAVDQVLEAEAFALLERCSAPLADEAVLRKAHSARHMREVEKAFSSAEMIQLEADTWGSSASRDAALRAVGASRAAVDDVFTGAADNVFVACRPPGHHAERNRPMGFCLFNNAALAAIHAQEAYGAERVAIIDWDVHHGNGTQDIFWDDDSVLFCSTHQMPLYPWTGAASETGVGNIVNAPLNDGAGSDTFREAFETVVLPRLEAFQPDLIVISAGFDAHHRDPLANILLTEQDFDWATGKLVETAGRHCQNRIVSLLEGGYDLVGLSLSVDAHVRRLMKG